MVLKNWTPNQQIEGLEALEKGEKFIVDWQYRLGGDFTMALSHTIMLADSENLDKIALAFPEEVIAFKRFSHEAGWWQKLEAKIQDMINAQEEER